MEIVELYNNSIIRVILCNMKYAYYQIMVKWARHVFRKRNVMWLFKFNIAWQPNIRFLLHDDDLYLYDCVRPISLFNVIIVPYAFENCHPFGAAKITLQLKGCSTRAINDETLFKISTMWKKTVQPHFRV